MRLTNGHKRWVYRVSCLVFGTGVLWLIFHYFLRQHGEFGDTSHPLEVWWLRLHGAGAMAALLVVGSLLPVHVRTGWHQRRNLGVGVGLLALALLLVVTGYGLYYFGGEELRPVLSITHWAAGLLGGLVMAWHVRRGRATRAGVETGRQGPAGERSAGARAQLNRTRS